MATLRVSYGVRPSKEELPTGIVLHKVRHLREGKEQHSRPPAPHCTTPRYTTACARVSVLPYLLAAAECQEDPKVAVGGASEWAGDGTVAVHGYHGVLRLQQ